MTALPPSADLSKVPLAPNPNGSPPNFLQPASQEATVISAGLPFAVVGALFVTIRLIASHTSARKVSLDDYLSVLAQVLMTACFGLAISFRRTARHAYDIPLSFIDEPVWIQRKFAINLVVGPALWSSKAAILALYLRLFGTLKWIRYTSYFTLIITFLFYWANTPLAGVYCTPRSQEGWGTEVLRRCAALSVMGPIQGAIGVAADLFILLLPLPIVLKLQLPRGKKAGLLVLFMMGIFALIASSVSLYYRVIIYANRDKFWNEANIYACVVVEGYITIIVSCAPAISSFWMNTFKKSALYASIRSGLKGSWSSRWMMSKATSDCATDGPVPQPGSLSGSYKGNDGYYELDDAVYKERPGRPDLPGEGLASTHGGIRKSTTTVLESSQRTVEQ
ncbi:MAG: hypothetical protein Q9222_003119 [Ikaeria aurantiellina]